MPVDDDVEVGVGGVVDAVLDQLGELGAVAAGAVAAGFGSVERQTHDVGVPVLAQLIEEGLVDVLREPGEAMGGDASELDGLAVVAQKLRAFDRESSSDGGCGVAGISGFWRWCA